MALILFAILLLLAGAALALTLPRNYHRAWASIGSQSAATLITLIAVVPALFNSKRLETVFQWSYPVSHIAVSVDATSAFFLAFSLPFTLLGTIYAFGYLAPDFEKQRHIGVHFALLNLVSVSFILIYTVQNALVFLLGWEVAAVSAWLLVIWEYRNQKIRFAGFNYLVSTHLGLLFLVAAFMVIHSSTGAFDFASFRPFWGTPSVLRNVTFLLLVTAFGLKSAFFPFHTWLPRAHSAAPAHVSALMSGVIHKAGLYGLLRFTLLMGTPDRWMGWFLILFSTISAILGVLYTVAQRDIKRLLGYSSTENVGIVGIGIGLGYLGLYWHQPTLVVLGFSGAILHVLNHALFKCLLFYCAGALYRSTHSIDIEKLGGLIKKMPQTAFMFLIGGLAISALPPLNGFVSEFLIYSGLLNLNIPDLTSKSALIIEAAILALVGGISALSMTRAFGIIFLGSPRDLAIEYHGEAKRSMRFTMALHSVGILVLGFVPMAGISLVRRPTEDFLNLLGESPTHSDYLTQAYSGLAPIGKMSFIFAAILFILVILRKFFLPQAQKGPIQHPTWGCGYAAVNSRMQYTGASFSSQFSGIYRIVLFFLRKEKLPKTPFPESGHLNTHCVDAVERRMFKVLGEGENMILNITRQLREDSHFSFSLGLAVLLILIGLVINTTLGGNS
ncbi:proton-conducting transporter membrane subunit [Bdellovibrionota bacterium FG-1]